MRMLHQLLLDIDQLLVVSRRQAHISSVVRHVPGALVVAQVGFQHRIAQVADLAFILDREDRLHAVIQVARHQVRAAQQHALLAGVMEIEDAAVLQVPAQHTHYTDVLAHLIHAGHQAAHSAHDQVHLHALLRSLVQQADHRRVDEGIHLENEVPAAPFLGMLDLALDQRFQLLPQVHRRHQQLAVFAHRRVAGEVIEQVSHVGGNILVAGEDADILVEVGGDVVVVAGGKVAVAPDGFAFAAHHHPHFAVDLETHQSVDHVHPRLLQHLRPGDVAFLVKARFELHQHRHLLAAFGGFQQRLHHRGVLPHPVKRLLDRQHLRVAGSRQQKIHHRREGIIRMVQQDMLPLDDVKYLARVLDIPERAWDNRVILGILQVDAVGYVVDFRQAHQVKGAAQFVDVRALDLQVLRQQFADARGHVLMDGDHHRRAEFAALDARLHRLDQILRLESPGSQCRHRGPP